jgi:hypothetical protein
MIFSHIGDTGDLIAALPYVQMKGGGDLLLYAGPGAVREPFTPAKVELLKNLYLRILTYPLGELPTTQQRLGIKRNAQIMQ